MRHGSERRFPPGFREALAFALEHHHGQLRKGSGVPYVTHPVIVAETLAYHYPDRSALLLAGLLHDVVEDTDATAAQLRERFGDEVADLVMAVTKPGSDDERSGRGSTEASAEASAEPRAEPRAEDGSAPDDRDPGTGDAAPGPGGAGSGPGGLRSGPGGLGSGPGGAGHEFGGVGSGPGDADSGPSDAAKVERWRAERRGMLDALAGKGEDALRLKAADALANLRSIRRDLQNPAVGAAVWRRFKVGAEESLGYYGAVVERLGPIRGERLTVELEAELARVRALSGVDTGG